MTTRSSPPRPPTAPPGWRVEATSGDAGPFHARAIPDGARHLVWIHEVDRPALVLGSTQTEAIIDQDRAEADGVEVCHRRSGGGLVPLSPGHDCWIDVIVPRDSPLWDDDVGRAFAWLGRAWALTLTEILPAGSSPAEVYKGPLQGGAAGRLLCFASLGPGEVTVAGRKIVGISQRRTRDGARFQAVAIGRWRPELVERYVDPEALAAARVVPATVAAGLASPGDVPWPEPRTVAAAFCRRLPALAPG